jgi:RNA polymerase sigma-70 factor, ECF subfamily
MYLVSERSTGTLAEIALREFDHVYSFIYSRVGNRADAEDLTQQVALKALPRLREGYPGPAVRSYLYTTARSVMASFWSHRARVPEAELEDDVWVDGRGDELACPPAAAAWLHLTLNALTPNYRQVLELRFLRGYSLLETAAEMGKTVGGIKVMQLRALRAAARVGAVPPPVTSSVDRSPRSHREREAGRGSAYVPVRGVQGG